MNIETILDKQQRHMWGCMQGIEFVKDRETKEPAIEETAELFEATRRRGLLIGSGGTGNAMRFTPPLNVKKEEIEQALKILDDAIGEVQATVC